MKNRELKHAMSIDVEDYYQVSAFETLIDRADWDKWPSRVEDNTARLLRFYDERDIQATFFVLGAVADQYPQIVRDIAAAGHEVACHGFSHRLIYNQSQEVFRDETLRSKHLLQDLSGQPVNGYRAASYSITRDSLWALDILAEAGFTYDSSIFPVYHDRYGIPDAPREVHVAETASGNRLTEIPMSTTRLGKLRIPIAGGGYFRLYPYWLTRWLWRKAIKQTHSSQVFYLHPWEIDPDQPVVENAPATTKLRHYMNLGRCEQRLDRLSRDFPFTTMQSLVDDTDIESLPVYRYQ